MDIAQQSADSDRLGLPVTASDAIFDLGLEHFSYIIPGTLKVHR